MKKVILATAVFVALFGSSCQRNDVPAIDNQAQNSPARISQNIEGTWKLLHYEDKKKVGFEVNISFLSDKSETGDWMLSGKSAVNQYFANYQLNKDTGTLKVLMLGSTKMAGPPEKMLFELGYFERLRQVGIFKIEQDNLTLKESTSSTESMVFSRIK